MVLEEKGTSSFGFGKVQRQDDRGKNGECGKG